MRWADILTLIWILLKGSIKGNFFSLIIFLLFCFHGSFTYLYQNFKKCKRSMPVQLNSLKHWWFLNYFSLIKLQIKISNQLYPWKRKYSCNVPHSRLLKLFYWGKSFHLFIAHFIFLNHLFQIISLALYTHTPLHIHTDTRWHVYIHTYTRKMIKKSADRQKLCNQITSQVMMEINKRKSLLLL